ncbi:MAG TPA: ATP-dependent helicase [Saprospiraceae bacterium]|nr:ATP-dependent helicase [Saprospiraceae bacterium]
MSAISLSPKQREIVDTKDGALLVKASAGSGKTRVLTERIKILIPKSKRKILAITFTNKAGEEMKDRLKDLDNLNDRLFIGTFHGFCQQVLESHGNLIGLSKMPHIFEDESDRLKIIEEALLSSPYYNSLYQEKTPKEQKSFLYDVLGFISEVKRQLLNEKQLLEQTKDQDNVLLFKEYQDILFSQNAIDFDDLILLTYNLFATQPSIASLYRRTYEYICIDEAQDLNNAQYQLLKIITGDEHKNVMMVGDPNQSIFAFNGSSSDFMNKEFIKDFDPLVIELKENYRSAKKVLQAAEKIMPNSNDISNTIKEGVFQVVETDNEDHEAKWIYEKINELIETKTYPDIEGIVTSDRIVILARNKYVFTPLEKI